MRRFLAFFLLLLFCAGGLYSFDEERLPTKIKGEAYYHFMLGKIYELEGEGDKALAEYDRALAIDKTAVPVYEAIAALHFYQGRVGKAIDSLTQALKVDPGSGTSYRLLGEIYYQLALGEPGGKETIDLAVRYLERARELKAEDGKLHLLLGRLYFLKKDFNRSISALIKHLEFEPRSEEGFLLLAQDYIQLADFVKAEESLNKAAEIAPADLRPLITLINIYRYNQNYKLLLETYEKALLIEPSEPEFLRGVAFSYLKLGKPKEAIALLDKLLAGEPNDIASLRLKAECYYELADFVKAEELFKRAVEFAPEEVESIFAYARFLGDINEYDRAIEMYKKLISPGKEGRKELIAGNKETVFANLGLLYYRSGRYREALDSFSLAKKENADFSNRLFPFIVLSHFLNGEKEKAFSLIEDRLKESDDVDIVILKANLLAESGELEEGVVLIRGLIKLYPSELRYHTTLGNLYLRAKRYRQGVPVVRSSLRSFPESDRLYFILGALYERSGRFVLAERALVKAIELNKENDSALNYLGYMLADRGIRLREAMSYIKRALSIAPANGSYLDSLGWVYFKQGKLELARRYLEDAARKEPTSGEIREHLGDLYFRLKKYQEAVSYYKEALSLKVDDPEKIADKIKRAERLIKK
jgi:tetratricopeptide (TPR) repeat protein